VVRALKQNLVSEQRIPRSPVAPTGRVTLAVHLFSRVCGRVGACEGLDDKGYGCISQHLG
jgi:hypothetical protein